MSARRNSPRIDQLGTVGAVRARSALNRTPPAPMQSEMRGMETSDAVSILASVERQRDQKREKSRSKEDLFDFQLRSHGMPKFERQVMFAKSIGRRWMFDFANDKYRVAVEVEGLVVMRVNGELIVKGRHASITGFKDDAIKYASAAILGWSVVRFEQSQVKDGTAIELTQRLLASRGWTR
jgi:very-short-patch-repair endonuclease